MNCSVIGLNGQFSLIILKITFNIFQMGCIFICINFNISRFQIPDNLPFGFFPHIHIAEGNYGIIRCSTFLFCFIPLKEEINSCRHGNNYRQNNIRAIFIHFLTPS